MGAQNIKEFSVEWVVMGLLFFCLITFAATFMYNNNPDALGDEGERIFQSGDQIESSLLQLNDGSNNLLNISSQSNPEVSDLGSKDSVATSYGITGTAASKRDAIMPFVKWVLSPDPNAEEGTISAGVLLVYVLLGLFGMTALFFIIKLIRTGN